MSRINIAKRTLPFMMTAILVSGLFEPFTSIAVSTTKTVTDVVESESKDGFPATITKEVDGQTVTLYPKGDITVARTERVEGDVLVFRPGMTYCYGKWSTKGGELVEKDPHKLADYNPNVKVNGRWTVDNSKLNHQYHKIGHIIASDKSAHANPQRGEKYIPHAVIQYVGFKGDGTDYLNKNFESARNGDELDTSKVANKFRLLDESNLGDEPIEGYFYPNGTFDGGGYLVLDDGRQGMVDGEKPKDWIAYGFFNSYFDPEDPIFNKNAPYQSETRVTTYTDYKENEGYQPGGTEKIVRQHISSDINIGDVHGDASGQLNGKIKHGGLVATGYYGDETFHYKIHMNKNIYQQTYEGNVPQIKKYKLTVKIEPGIATPTGGGEFQPGTPINPWYKDKQDGYVLDYIKVNDKEVTAPPTTMPEGDTVVEFHFKVVESMSFTSEPLTYAEFKEGKPDNETFEAMSGVPSTEKLYIAVGGSEFMNKAN